MQDIDRLLGMHLDTCLIHADDDADDSSITPPITYSATFQAHSAEMFAEIASVPMHDEFYTRNGNPLHTRVAKLIAALEGAETGLVAGSGMGAISSTILGLVAKGDHVVAQRNLYVGTSKVIGELLPRFGVEFTFVDATDSESFAAAIRPNTKLIMVETPANPLLSVTDLTAVAVLAKKHNILSICDNTFASPINQTPMRFGIDIVVHSATKFLGGHHDITAGVVVSRKEIITKIWSTLTMLGPTLSPMDAWLLLRGLRTLSLRVERQNESALKISGFLHENKKVDRVFYPGLASHPQHALAKKQMSGFGGVVTFEYKGSFAETAKFASRLKIPKNAVSLGGVETLLVQPSVMWGSSMTDAQMKSAGIQPNLIRLSVGLEHADDLIKDLEAAL